MELYREAYASREDRVFEDLVERSNGRYCIDPDANLTYKVSGKIILCPRRPVTDFRKRAAERRCLIETSIRYKFSHGYSTPEQGEKYIAEAVSFNQIMELENTWLSF